MVQGDSIANQASVAWLHVVHIPSHCRAQLSQPKLNNQQVYETPDQAFYEDVSKINVGGAGDHTHTPAMELSQCPAYAPTEVPAQGRGRRNN